MVRAGFFYHLVEDSPFRGPSRSFTIHGGDEIVVEGLSFRLGFPSGASQLTG